MLIKMRGFAGVLVALCLAGCATGSLNPSNTPSKSAPQATAETNQPHTLLPTSEKKAADHADTVYPCVSAFEGKGEVRLFFRDDISKLQSESDPAKREKALKREQKMAATDMERALVAINLGAVYMETGRSEEAVKLLEPLLKNPYLARAQLDAVRTMLAGSAITQKDYDTVIALLDPIAKANCAPMPQEAPYLLAFALLQKQRSRDALMVLDKASQEPPSDADWWRGVHAELHCKLDGPAACVTAVAKYAEPGGLSPELTDVFNTLLAGAVSKPEAAEALADAQKKGLIDASGKVIARPPVKEEQLVPVYRVAPLYPGKAVEAGVSGFVKLEIVVNPDGTVKKASVLDASPRNYGFESAILNVIFRWKFKPKLVNGVAVESGGYQTIDFRME